MAVYIRFRNWKAFFSFRLPPHAARQSIACPGGYIHRKGRLVKKGAFWQFDGKDVTIKFLIRVDDPNGRLLAGCYMADQIEKAGIKVERLERDRSAIKIAYYSNPADLEYHIYTEGWGAGATRAWWDVVVSQMYAPYYGYMPGGAEPANWNYENPRIDEIGKKGSNGQFLSADDYWKSNLEGIELGVKDAVRIYIASQLDKYVANKARFNSRMSYGLDDGQGLALHGLAVRSNCKRHLLQPSSDSATERA